MYRIDNLFDMFLLCGKNGRPSPHRAARIRDLPRARTRGGERTLGTNTLQPSRTRRQLSCDAVSVCLSHARLPDVYIWIRSGRGGRGEDGF